MRTLKDLVRAGSLVVAGLALGVSPAWSAEFWLDARPLVGAENPAGIPQAVPMWGYASCDANWACGAPTVPGPQLVVPAGDTSGLTIHLMNSLPVPTSIVIPAQREDGMGAANPAYKDSNVRMRAFTREATQGGGIESYTWSNLTPGTYLYHSGSHVQVQVPMGLYGGLKHDDGVGRAYPGVNYDYETMLLFSEVDPILNAAVANSSYGTAPAPTSAIGYRPQYFLINGAVYVPTTPPIQVGLPNERKLLRFLNAGLRSHVPTLQNGFFHLKAEDGHLLPHGGHEQYSAVLPAGKTIDAMWIPTLNETYALYDGRLNDSMLMKMAVGVPRPATQPDVYATTENQTLNVQAPGVLANDGPPGPPALTAQLVSNVTDGTLTLNSDGSFTYVPPAGFNGTATFQYRANDGAVLGYMATVTITVGPVNDPPVANPDSATGKSGSQIQILVLDNDTDIDDPLSALRVDSVTTPTNGTATIAPNGLSVTYTSALGFSGDATFTYIARDAAGALSQPATVTVTVLPNAPPVAVDDSVTVGEDSGPIVISVLVNDSDPDVGDTLSVSSVGTPTGGGGTATTNGTTVTYTPALNFSGTTSFTYQVSDGSVTSQGTVTVTVTPVSDPPVAVNDVILVTRYGTFIAPAPGVLANDSDPEGATLTASLVSGAHATFTLGSDGSVTYTPPVEFIGNRTFTYQASDGALTSAAATARLAKLLAVKKAEFTNPAGTAQDKWAIEGKASSFAGTSVTIYVGPTPGGPATVIATVPIVLNASGTSGTFKYAATGSNIVPPDASNMISVMSNNGTIFTDVPVTLK